jgi:hypothetical protein
MLFPVVWMSIKNTKRVTDVAACGFGGDSWWERGRKDCKFGGGEEKKPLGVELRFGLNLLPMTNPLQRLGGGVRRFLG